MLCYVAYREFLGCYRPYDPPRYATSDEDPSLASGPRRQTKVYPQSTYKVVRCEEPQSAKEYELCQQRNSARANEDAVCVARAQYYLAIVGLLFIVGTFAANAVAGWGAKQAANVGRDTLVASQRAWIRRDKISFGSPLQFRRDGLMHSSIQFEFTNVGNSPALHINEFVWLLPVTNGGIPEARALELFKEVRQHPVSGGFALFPRQRYPRRPEMWVRHGIHLTKAEADAATDGGDRISLYVAACINYSFASDPNRNHQTSCLFEVERTTAPFITRSGGDIPETELRLQDSGFLGMDIAD